MQTLPKFDAFKPYACGEDFITLDVGALRVVATLRHDSDTRPEHSECYTEEQIAAWNKDEWFYVGVVLSVQVGDTVLDDHAASLWGIECNFPGADNSYLSEVANQLLPDALRAARTTCEGWANNARIALEALAQLEGAK